MALQDTNLIITASNLPANFRGTPQQFFAALVARMKIMSPVGVVSIVISDSEPTTNQGLWLKGGTKPYVFDTVLARYVPADVSDSTPIPFWISETVPEATSPDVWVRYSGSNFLGIYFYNGTQWVPSAGIVQSIPDPAARPANPYNLQQVYQADIGALIWYERGEWRTISGEPGDIKQVVHETLAEALRYNPGWDVLGANQTSWRGRILGQATKDPGTSPGTRLSVPAGIAERAAHEVFGETDGVKMDASSAVPYPPTIALWTLYKK